MEILFSAKYLSYLFVEQLKKSSITSDFFDFRVNIVAWCLKGLSLVDQCKKFWYHGCGGNANRYYSFASCSSVCQNVTSKSAELTGPVHPIGEFDFL